MRFRFEQRLSHPADRVQAGLLDPEFLTRLGSLPRLGRIELVSLEHDGDLVHRQVRYAFAGNLPSAVTAVVDPKKLSWIEDATVDCTEMVTDWTILPDHYADRLKSSGTFVIEPQGSGCRRITEGEVKVSFPLVGGRVERVVVEGLEEHLEAEALALDEWLS